MNCTRCRALFSSRADQLLPDGSATLRAVEQHLAGCAACQQEWDGFQRAIGALHDLRAGRATERETAAVLHAIEQSVAPAEAYRHALLLTGQSSRRAGGALRLAAALLLSALAGAAAQAWLADASRAAPAAGPEQGAVASLEAPVSGDVELPLGSVPPTDLLVRHDPQPQLPSGAPSDAPVQEQQPVPPEHGSQRAPGVQVERPSVVRPVLVIDTAPLVAAVREAGAAWRLAWHDWTSTSVVEPHDVPDQLAGALQETAAAASPLPLPSSAAVPLPSSAGSSAAAPASAPSLSPAPAWRARPGEALVSREGERLTLCLVAPRAEVGPDFHSLVPPLLALLGAPDEELAGLAEARLESLRAQAEALPGVGEELLGLQTEEAPRDEEPRWRALLGLAAAPAAPERVEARWQRWWAAASALLPAGAGGAV